MPPKKVAQLMQFIKTGINNKKISKKFKISESYVRKIFKIKSVKKAPAVTEEQRIKQKKRLTKLARNLIRPKNGIDIIFDDKCYFSILIVTI
jgi:AraC-like DNA-binding protein